MVGRMTVVAEHLKVFRELTAEPLVGAVVEFERHLTAAAAPAAVLGDVQMDAPEFTPLGGLKVGVVTHRFEFGAAFPGRVEELRRRAFSTGGQIVRWVEVVGLAHTVAFVRVARWLRRLRQAGQPGV